MFNLRFFVCEDFQFEFHILGVDFGCTFCEWGSPAKHRPKRASQQHLTQYIAAS